MLYTKLSSFIPKHFNSWNFNTQVSDVKLICFKNPNNLSCIDLFPANTIRSFQETQVFKTGLSDFHKLVVTVVKSTFAKSPQKIYNNNI